MKKRESEERREESERRIFLKKAIYRTPVLIAMGQLIKPEKARAESDIPPPPF